MRTWWILLFLPLVWAGAAAWWFREPLGGWLRGVSSPVELGKGGKAVADPEAYAVLVSELERWRRELAQRHRNARNDAARKAVEHDARVVLELVLPEMMRCWLGTPWDFNGTASRPGAGAIACGYYVATVIRDAGFDVDRYKLAQQPSGNILRSFLDRDACRLSIGKAYGDFVEEMSRAEPGIYLIGLDTHVAFLVVADRDFRFIHSSGSRPWCVVDEGRAEAQVLQRSNWRMTGNLTADPKVLRRWLRSEKIQVVKRE
jgi:hypothetical protein